MRAFVASALLLCTLHLASCAPVVRSVTPARAAPLDLSGPAPDVVVLGIGGHCAAPCRAPRDNHDTLSGRGVLDALADTLAAQGYRVQVAGYAANIPETFKSPFLKEPQRGYLGMVDDVRRIQAAWPRAQGGPRLVVVGHSQGAAWSHLLTSTTPEIRYAVQIDLDGQCTFWAEDFQAEALRRSAQFGALNVLSPLSACETLSTPAGPYLSKDIVWPNVERNLEVQSKHYPARPGAAGGLPLSYLFDRVTNIRLDGTRTGIQRLVSRSDDHSAVTDPRSESIQWVTERLAALAQEWRVQDAR